MKINKRYILILGAITIILFVVGYTKNSVAFKEVDNEEYVEDEYEKFLQEKVLPDMIKNNNAIQGGELGQQQDEGLSNEGIEIGEGTIHLEDDKFLEKLDKLHMNLNEYIGREISFEGVVYKLEEKEGPRYVIGKYFEESHGEHSHENFFGLQCSYQGQWPDEDTVVKVEGKLGKNSFNGQELPMVIVENLTIMNAD